MKKHIPNTLTLGNLTCGAVAIIQIFSGNLQMASYIIGVALVFDFLDGFTARMLRVSSEIGKQLDSLSDLVTFGAAPAFLMYHLLLGSLPNIERVTDSGVVILLEPDLTNSFILWCPLLILLLSSLRLARFNVDENQSDSFIGLPTPSCAIVVASLPLIQMNDEYGLFQVIYNPVGLAVISLILALLLVLPVPLLALKFKNFSVRQNLSRYVLILVAIVSVVVFQFTAIPFVIMFYILLSILSLALHNKP